MKCTITSLVLLFLAMMTGWSQSTPIVSTTTDSTSQGQQQDEYGIFDTFSGNPGKAALYSLIFPGAGQFYNKRYWKVPLALAAEGAAIYFLRENINEFKKWDGEWKFQLSEGTFNPAVTTVYNPNAIKKLRDNARQQKDYSWVTLIGVHLIITAEAFIDRHLIEFDVSEDLSMDVIPARNAIGAGVVFTF